MQGSTGNITEADDAAAWNLAHPVGTPVTYWPGFRDGEGRTGRTRTEAFLMGGKDAKPVVFIEGMAGWVALTHVEVAST